MALKTILTDLEKRVQDILNNLISDDNKKLAFYREQQREISLVKEKQEKELTNIESSLTELQQELDQIKDLNSRVQKKKDPDYIAALDELAKKLGKDNSFLDQVKIIETAFHEYKIEKEKEIARLTNEKDKLEEDIKAIKTTLNSIEMSIKLESSLQQQLQNYVENSENSTKRELMEFLSQFKTIEGEPLFEDENLSLAAGMIISAQYYDIHKEAKRMVGEIIRAAKEAPALVEVVNITDVPEEGINQNPANFFESAAKIVDSESSTIEDMFVKPATPFQEEKNRLYLIEQGVDGNDINYTTTQLEQEYLDNYIANYKWLKENGYSGNYKKATIMLGRVNNAELQKRLQIAELFGFKAKTIQDVVALLKIQTYSLTLMIAVEDWEDQYIAKMNNTHGINDLILQFREIAEREEKNNDTLRDRFGEIINQLIDNEESYNNSFDPQLNELREKISSYASGESEQALIIGNSFISKYRIETNLRNLLNLNLNLTSEDMMAIACLYNAAKTPDEISNVIKALRPEDLNLGGV